MSQIIQEPEVDVAVLGLGVAGGIIATELATSGYKVVGIDKGPLWDYANDFSQTKYDEWGVGFMRKFDHPLELYTSTLRNTRNQFANPMRRYTIPLQVISLGHGVGGAAHHYAAAMGRYGPWTYEEYSATVSRYGLDFLNAIQPNQDLEDWPMTYDEYEPYYVEWEKAWGVVGTNQGPLVPMSQNYPLPPHPSTPVGELFQRSTEAMGYNPYPSPNALASQAYVNQYGVQVNGCVYDGWCGGLCNYACEVGAKANSAFRTIPAAIKSGNFTLVTNSWVFRLDVDPATGNSTAVRYYDPAGVVHVQPAKAFAVGLWGHNIARLMLLSGLGIPYDPVTVTGTVGRGLSDGVFPLFAPLPSATGTLNMGANAYPAGNASGGGFTMYDLTDDNFDHTGLNFIGGNMPAAGTYAGGGPGNLVTAGLSGAGSMGSTYKAALKDMNLPTTTTVSISMPGPEIPTTDSFIDLDPHYVDVFGDPLARETLDWSNNMYNCANYMAPQVTNILEKMGCSNISVSPQSVAPGTYHEDSMELHRRGGLRVGSDWDTSALNKYQQSWACFNLFAAGEITDTVGTYNTAGTHGMGPGCYVAAEGIKKYLSSPGPLV